MTHKHRTQIKLSSECKLRLLPVAICQLKNEMSYIKDNEDKSLSQYI